MERLRLPNPRIIHACNMMGRPAGCSHGRLAFSCLPSYTGCTRIPHPISAYRHHPIQPCPPHPSASTSASRVAGPTSLTGPLASAAALAAWKIFLFVEDGYRPDCADHLFSPPACSHSQPVLVSSKRRGPLLHKDIIIEPTEARPARRATVKPKSYQHQELAPLVHKYNHTAGFGRFSSRLPLCHRIRYLVCSFARN